MAGKGGVESVLGNVGVESRESDTGDMYATITAGFCAARRNETEFLREFLVDIVLPFRVLYNMLLVLLDTSTETDTDMLLNMSESNLSRLFVQSKENLLKRGYFSGCLAMALTNILRKNPLASP